MKTKASMWLLVVLIYVKTSITSSQDVYPGHIVNPVCGEPGIPVNGTRTPVKPAYLRGEIVTYICDKGFYLMGAENRRCRNDGSWTESVPFCDENIAKEDKLKNPEGVRDMIDGNIHTSSIINANMTIDLRFEKRLKIQQIRVKTPKENVKHTFKLYSNNEECRRRCLKGSCETSLDFFCESNEATKLYLIKINSETLHELSVQEIVIFKEREEHRCGRPDVPLNGAIFNARRWEWKYSCNSGYELNPMRRIKCKRSGVWSEGPPVCETVGPKACPEGFGKTANKCFLLFKRRVNNVWDAADICYTKNAVLAEIPDHETHKGIMNYLKREGMEDEIAIFLGMNDIRDEGIWRLYNGTLLPLPENGGVFAPLLHSVDNYMNFEDCSSIQPTLYYRMNDISCTIQQGKNNWPTFYPGDLPFLCEFKGSTNCTFPPPPNVSGFRLVGFNGSLEYGSVAHYSCSGETATSKCFGRLGWDVRNLNQSRCKDFKK